MYHRSCQTICAGLFLLPSSSPPPNSSPSSSEVPLNSPLSPFKSPLPVYPPPNNKTAHLLPSSPHLTPKSLSNCALLDSLNSPSKTPTQPQHQCSYPGMVGLEFAPYIHIEKQPNGGALVAHAYTSQLSSLSPGQMQRFAQEFVTLSFSEDSSQVRQSDVHQGSACYLIVLKIGKVLSSHHRSNSKTHGCVLSYLSPPFFSYNTTDPGHACIHVHNAQQNGPYLLL